MAHSTIESTRVLGRGGDPGSAFGERGLDKRISKLARIQCPPGGDLLDVGCGPGAYTLRMAADYDSVVGMDVDRTRVEAFARGIPPGRQIAAMVGDAEHMPYPDESFDAVTAIEVLEHISNLPACLREVHRVLKPGGIFFLTTPNRWFPVETHGVTIRGRRRRGLWACFVTWVRPVHRRVSGARAFTRRELLTINAAAGFQLVGSDYMMPPFDLHPAGRRIRPITDKLESSPLRVFSMTHVMAFRR